MHTVIHVCEYIYVCTSWKVSHALRNLHRGVLFLLTWGRQNSGIEETSFPEYFFLEFFTSMIGDKCAAPGVSVHIVSNLSPPLRLRLPQEHCMDHVQLQGAVETYRLQSDRLRVRVLADDGLTLPCSILGSASFMPTVALSQHNC